LIAEKAGHNGFHHRIPDLEKRPKDLLGLCRNDLWSGEIAKLRIGTPLFRNGR